MIEQYVQSPITGKVMEVVSEPSSVNFRGDKIAYTHFAYRCPDTGEQFTTTDSDEVNENQVYDQYRFRHGIPFPEEIVGLRMHYGVSAAMMSRIMGFGANQWRNYEDGVPANESNGRAIIAIRHRDTFMEYVKAAGDAIDDKARQKILAHAGTLPPYFAIDGQRPENGFVAFSPQRLTQIIASFTTMLGKTFITKMNKLLFYLDFMHYRLTGRGVTGLCYVAEQFGPIPQNYTKVYGNLDGVRKQELIDSVQQGTVLWAAAADDEPGLLTQEQRALVERVAERFKDFTCQAISEYSHKEPAWVNHQAAREVIPYADAFFLSID